MHSVRSRRLALLLIAVVGVLILGATASSAGDAFVAGGRSTRAVPAGRDDLARARDRAQSLSLALGLPGRSERVERLLDVFDHRTYDEVTNVDTAGRDVAITRFDVDGTPAMAVRLGWTGSGVRSLAAQSATRRAMAIAAAAGLSVAGQPEARESAGAGGWSVAWPRTLNGVAVRGDGLRISLWSDGSFHGLTRTERSLAARPGRTLTEGDARARATRFVAEQLGADRSALSVTTAEQAWVAPNGMFLAEAPDAPAAILRLAWIVRFDATGTTAERLRSVEIWLDAGDGTIIGGDVVE